MTICEVDLLCDLPDFVLTQVNNHWLIRMGERIIRIGHELGEGRTPQPECPADSYTAWIVINNTDTPQGATSRISTPAYETPLTCSGTTTAPTTVRSASSG